MATSQVHNTSKTNDDDSKGSWHHQNSIGGSKMTNYPTNSDGLNDSSNDANKANYNAMTKKRKAMHQANSNRNSADENSSKWVDFSVVSVSVPTKFVRTLWIFSKILATHQTQSFHRDPICKDLSVKVVPLDKLDLSVSSEFERHYKKVSHSHSYKIVSAATPDDERLSLKTSTNTRETRLCVYAHMPLHSHASTMRLPFSSHRRMHLCCRSPGFEFTFSFL